MTTQWGAAASWLRGKKRSYLWKLAYSAAKPKAGNGLSGCCCWRGIAEGFQLCGCTQLHGVMLWEWGDVGMARLGAMVGIGMLGILPWWMALCMGLSACSKNTPSALPKGAKNGAAELWQGLGILYFCGSKCTHQFEYMNAQAGLLIPSFPANYIFMALEFQSKLYFYKALCMSNESLDMKAFFIRRYLGNRESVVALLL